MLKTIPMKDAALVQVHGRTTACREPLTLFWSASGLEMNLKAGELWVEFETDYSVHAQWVSVLLNGAHIGRFLLPKGRVWMPILHGLNPEKVNHIEIIRDVQAMPTDPDCILQIHALRTDGEFVPVEPKTMKLEIIGDSITSAEGSIGAKEETDWIAPLFCSARGYAFTTAKALNADLHVLSQSGWGVNWDWQHMEAHNMTDGYELVAGVLEGPAAEKRGCRKMNDFSAWQPDLVCIRLMTNDWNGIRERNSLEADREKVISGCERLIRKVRKNNPEAGIVWILPGSDSHPELAAEAVARLRREGMDRLRTFTLPDWGPEDFGARAHPNAAWNRKAGGLLADFLKTLL